MSIAAIIKWALYRDSGLIWVDPTHAVTLGYMGGGAFAGANLGSGTYPVANQLYAFPFSLASPKTLTKILVPIGATSSGNIDVALLDSTGARLSSAGSTPMGSTNALQTFDITDVALAPGTFYYAAVAVDNTTGTLVQTTGIIPGVGQLAGWRTKATGFPIAASNTLVAPSTNATWPVLQLEFAA